MDGGQGMSFVNQQGAEGWWAGVLSVMPGSRDFQGLLSVLLLLPPASCLDCVLFASSVSSQSFYSFYFFICSLTSH